MQFIDTFGYAAAFLTTFSFFPQAYKTIKTKDTTGISLSMYCAFTVGVISWLIYGFMIWSIPMMLGNFITLIPATTILVLTFQNNWRSREKL